MRDLRGLLATPDGRAVLAGAGISTDPTAFLSALDGRGRQTVYVHQQPGADYRRSVTAKLVALAALHSARPDRVDPLFVLIDTDRAHSSKAATRIAWQDGAGHRHLLKLTPAGTERLEFRHLPVDPPQLAAVADRLAAYVRQLPAGRAAAGDRLDRLRPLLAPAVPVPFGAYAAAVGGFLLRRRLGQDLPTATVSDMTADGSLAAVLASLLGALEDFVAAFNARVAGLRAAGIATAVGPLPPDYLPLFYSCPAEGSRLRLRRVRRGGAFFAEGVGPAGVAYSFPLGTRGNDLDAILAAGRWSPDVTLPVLLAGRFAGMVAGRSSALYSLVLTSAMRAALGRDLGPILVPAALGEDLPGPDGLLQAWLTG